MLFSVDAPDDARDLVRIVLSDDDACVIDHAVLLAERLPVGSPVIGGLRNDHWNVTVDPQRQAVAFATLDGAPLLAIRLQGGGPCTAIIEVAAGVQAWGLGQCFAPPDARVDWMGHRRTVDERGVYNDFKPYGHGQLTYVDGTEGYIQIPVLLMAGGPQPFAIVLDYVYRIEADFTTNPWLFQLGSATAARPTFPVRMYVVAGATAIDVRRRIMDLLGRPPLPPRKLFGMWVSEYGFENWNDVDRVVGGLRGGSFPVDGVVLDLYWFGGVAQQAGVDHSAMGRLGWDITDTPLVDDPFFPDPHGRLAEYARRHLEFALIEESYVSPETETFHAIQQAVEHPYVRVDSTILRFPDKWVGKDAAMLDWTDPGVGQWMHENRRKPFMVDYGVRVHWTDLGEPELFSPAGTYRGVDLDGHGTGRTAHADVANVYNLAWHHSIDRGYAQSGDGNRRRLLLSRSGSAGIQRFGAAIWSGDTGSRMDVLVAQLHAQAHMVCSGIDYYGSDVGGFHRHGIDAGRMEELYTQWFANSAWFDVPLRPHVDNSAFYNNRAEGTIDGPERQHVAPYEVGHRPSNLENLRTRYRLIPYYYALARRCQQTGAPLMPPPGMVYSDSALKGIAHQKLIGEDVMVAGVAGHGEYCRNVYLPAGTWYDLYSGERYLTDHSEWFTFIPEYRDGLFRLPAFVRGGAILPMMHVDADTLDAFGHRRDGGRYEDLILRVFDGDDAPDSFTVYEDDGDTRDSQAREVLVERRREEDRILVTVHAANSVAGLADLRPLIVELVSALDVAEVTVNGDALAALPVVSRDDRGWTRLRTRSVRACVPAANVGEDHTFAFRIAGPARTTASLLLVCDHAFTDWGEDVYARFIRPLQTGDGVVSELKLDPSVTYAYLYPQPPDAQRNCPIWTRHLTDLDPDQEVRLVYEKRRGGVVVGANPRQLYRSSGPGGYVGELRGSL